MAQVFMYNLPPLVTSAHNSGAAPGPLMKLAFNATMPMKSVNTRRGLRILTQPFHMIDRKGFFLDHRPDRKSVV
jgi:hypothetical protein